MKKYLLLIISIINAAVLTVLIAASDAVSVPIHYSISGAADNYSTKWSLLIFALLPLAVSSMFTVYRRFATGNENIARNKKYEDKALLFITLFFVLISWLITLNSLNGAEILPSGVLGTICAALGLLMMLISNLLAKLKPNRTLGIRTKATLSDETVWKKTHRLSGYTGIAGGLIMTVCGILSMFGHGSAMLIYAVIAFIILECVVPMIYAEVLFRKIKAE